MRSVFPHLLLFFLTVASTLFVGGVIYSASLLSILLAHEMGHYLASRYHGVKATLPYFIPFPLPPFGTLGAVIRTKSPIPHRRALLDIGAAGPLSGLCVAIPAIVVGLLHSRVVDVSQIPKETIRLGNPPLFAFIQRLTLGELPSSKDVILHPIAYAGWVGLFVTALNLLPAGQLDGGHIVYSLFGRYSRIIFRMTILTAILICLIYNFGWLLLVVLLLFIGYRHPPPLDDFTPLDGKRRFVGAITLAIFFLSFTPVPFPSWAMGLKDILWGVR
ncbi:MAG: site-2 protease family protein [Deltaproteobacteria bacterium]|nr:MAG: site-2 protease family protein [Deltaproteobacteria bacterium]